MTSRPLAALSDTVNTRSAEPLFPSVTLAEAMDTVGGSSSSVMVPVAEAVETVAFTGFERVTVRVSSGSSPASVVTGTEMVSVVSFAAKVSVPETAV